MSLLKPSFAVPVKPEYFDVFLGGTTAFKDPSHDWRKYVIDRLKPSVKYFNPVVSDWNEYQQRVEERAKTNSVYKLYVITPQMAGVYSIAELVHDSIRVGDSTLICALAEYDGKRFTESQLRSLDATLEMCRRYNATILYTLDGIVEYINSNVRG